MAKDESFDVVSEVNMQEVDNAVNQTNKEIKQRFDFKNSKSEVSLEEDKKEIKIIADDDFKLRNVIDILQSKLIRRQVSIKNLEYGKVEEASGGTIRQIIKVQQGIETEIAKKIVKDIKNLKIKVQTQIMNDQIRVSGKVRDDLQTVIKFLREQEYNIELQFINYR